MPFKFWKREKAEKKAGAEETKGQARVKKEEMVPSPRAPAAKEVAVAKGPVAEPTPAKPPAAAPEEVAAAVDQVHSALVGLGLTIAGTKGVFSKRIASYPGGASAFVRDLREAPYKAGTLALEEWLGFAATADFDPPRLLDEVNLRLSSFKTSVQMTDLTWLDEELGLRKAKIRLGDEERVVRFKDARDFVKGINELLAPKKLAFLELETWTDGFAFLLVKEPQWEKLAASDLVIVKAPQTAAGGECGECGAPVGAHWHDCLSCGAVFGSD